MDKFGAFTVTEECNDCKDQLTWSEPVKIKVKPRGDDWTEIEKISLHEIYRDESVIFNWNDKEIMVLETVNPELAKYVFIELINHKLNATFYNGT